MAGYSATAETLPGGVYLVRVHPGAGGRFGDPYVAACVVVPQSEESGDRVAELRGLVVRDGHDRGDFAAGMRAVYSLLRSLGYDRVRYDRRGGVAVCRAKRL